MSINSSWKCLNYPSVSEYYSFSNWSLYSVNFLAQSVFSSNSINSSTSFKVYFLVSSLKYFWKYPSTLLSLLNVSNSVVKSLINFWLEDFKLRSSYSTPVKYFVLWEVASLNPLQIRFNTILISENSFFGRMFIKLFNDVK